MFNRWYQDGIFYCLDVETYADSNGDGVGDFNGLTSRLPHIAGLGFNCIWLLPLFASPILDDLRRLKRVYSLLLTLPKVGGRATWQLSILTRHPCSVCAMISVSMR